jgi:hypothetical protein
MQLRELAGIGLAAAKKKSPRGRASRNWRMVVLLPQPP